MDRMAGIGLIIALAIGYAELVGYGLHRLLHSELVPWLARRHLAHHVVLYGPREKMRTATCRDRDTGGAVGGIGWEWIGPSVVLFGVEIAILCALGIRAIHQAVFFVVGFLWSLVMFHRAHEAMHVTVPSLFHAWPLRRWFRRARRMHDIHHLAIDDDGRFRKNFGIGFFWFDRLFRTYAPKLDGVSDVGIARARARYQRTVMTSR